MVATQQEDAVGVLDLEGEEEADGLDALAPAQEQIGGLGREASVLEEAQHVVVLAVDVAADLDGGVDLDEHGLGEEDGLHMFDESENF